MLLPTREYFYSKFENDCYKNYSSGDTNKRIVIIIRRLKIAVTIIMIKLMLMKDYCYS